MSRWLLLLLAVAVPCGFVACTVENIAPQWATSSGTATPTPSVTPSGSPSPSSTPIFASDFESDDAGLLIELINGAVPTTWVWGPPGGVGAHSGTKAWVTAINGNYSPSEYSCIYHEAAISPSGGTWSFWIRYVTGAGDFIEARSCASGGGGCTNLSSLSGNFNSSFQQIVHDLAPYAGTTRRLEICINADAATELSGAVVDDMTID